MKKVLLLLLLLSSLAVFSQDFRCPTDEVLPLNNDTLEDNQTARRLDFFVQSLSEDTLIIPVVWHVIYQGEKGLLDDEDIAGGIQNLNDAFANVGKYAGGPNFNDNGFVSSGTGIRFLLTKIMHHEDAMTDLDINEDDQLKTKYNYQTGNFLNIYSVSDICDEQGCSIGGYAYLAGAHGLYYDGIVIREDLLQHFALPHEAGHYLNLYHTFQNGCSSPGDRVDDTPYDAEPGPNICDGFVNSCTDAGVDLQDNWENYMDYGPDCKNNFTPMQIIRMRDALLNIRNSLLGNTTLPLTITKFTAKLDSTDVVIEVLMENAELVEDLRLEYANDSIDFMQLFHPDTIANFQYIHFNPSVGNNYYRVAYVEGSEKKYSHIETVYVEAPVEPPVSEPVKNIWIYILGAFILGVILILIGVRDHKE